MRGEEVHQKAEPVDRLVDTTGAGDLFASGFLFGLLEGCPLQRCCEMGCVTGGAVVQVWFHSQLSILPRVPVSFKNTAVALLALSQREISEVR